MRLRGSVLIVILGLLAVLAVVGIAFVTMSSIESNSASNYALQAQFDLAADGAVDYVCQALVRDVWEFCTNSTDTARYRTYTGYMLTGKYGTWPGDWPDPTTSTDVNNPTRDAYLATNWINITAPTSPVYSFRTGETWSATWRPYNLATFAGAGASGTNPVIYSSGNDCGPNNLGIPTGTAVIWNNPPNGLWLPELAFPFETGVVRTSVTVQDHAAMVNLNAHGSPLYTATMPSGLLYGKAAGKGYFTSDVTPIGVTGLVPSLTDITLLLDGSKTPPGRWLDVAGPTNKRLGEIFIQNPVIGRDRPFSLDDEFELRRLTGTFARSRLERIIGTALDSTPTNTTSAKVITRQSLTTVGWNAEVMPGQLASGVSATPKGDLNLMADQGSDVKFGTALDRGAVIPQTGTDARPNVTKRFTDNFLAFKDRYIPPSGSSYFKTYSGGYYGARRQAILSKVKVNVTRNSSSGKDKWDVRFQVFNPWYGNYAGDVSSSTSLGAIDTTHYRVRVYLSSSSTTAAKEFYVGRGTTTRSVPYRKSASLGVWDNALDGGVTTFEVNANQSLTKIAMEVNATGTTWLTIDQAMSADLGTAYPVTKRRLFGVYEEPRASDDTDDSCVVTVLYVKNRKTTTDPAGWYTATDGSWTSLEGTATEITKGAGIPIRFPHSVPAPDSTDPANKWDGKVDGPLRPYYKAGDASPTSSTKGIFKAFLRVGDLNQVLCPGGLNATEAETAAATTNFWPWVPTVAEKSSQFIGTDVTDLAIEKLVKWDWWRDTAVILRTSPVYDSSATYTPTNNQYRHFNAANIFCVDSPWVDYYDNDGDGKKDAEDTAYLTPGTNTGRFSGKEIRVAGRINLNTATDKTLAALGLGVTNSPSTYTNITASRPFTSPVEVLRTITAYAPDTECKGPLEKRDFWYTRISNIASVRSDTFSIYGTVQFVIPAPPDQAASASLSVMRIMRTRRFWALVDRSPALNFKPDSTSFLHPRVMNFQWLD
jgi:hypothetical protein